jgi:hypothetical protein
MADATNEVVVRGVRQFQGLFTELFTVSATLDAGNLVDGAGETNAVDVPGVELGDVVLAFSLGVSLAGITATAFVSAANVVSVRLQNESGGTLDLASTTFKAVVGRPAW